MSPDRRQTDQPSYKTTSTGCPTRSANNRASAGPTSRDGMATNDPLIALRRREVVGVRRRVGAVGDGDPGAAVFARLDDAALGQRVHQPRGAGVANAQAALEEGD